jgi:hypothetical protein
MQRGQKHNPFDWMLDCIVSVVSPSTIPQQVSLAITVCRITWLFKSLDGVQTFSSVPNVPNTSA